MAKRTPRPKRPNDHGAEDRAWASYSAAFRREVMPQLLSSAVFMAVFDGEGGGDREIQFATSLGLMLLYRKPIILAVAPGSVLPERLRLVADEVVDFDPDDPADQERMVAAFRRVRDRLGPEEGW